VNADQVMNFAELSDWLFNLRISNAMALLLFCVLSIAGLMYILSQLTKEIPKRLLIVVPIPLYLLTGLIAAIVYIYRN
jgi:amino acid transporter